VDAVDVSVVTFRPDLDLLERLFASIAEQAEGLAIRVYVQDNSDGADHTPLIRALPALAAGGMFEAVDVARSASNLGFGRGHNANAARGSAPLLWVLNQDCIVEPGVVRPLLEAAARDAVDVAAWEMRQIPYEHPKAYDPVTLDALVARTGWSAAELNVRLLDLELDGQVARLPGQLFQRVTRG